MNEPLVHIRRLKIYGWHDWQSVVMYREYNWIDIHWLWLHTEAAFYKETLCLSVGLLGFCAEVNWNYGELPKESDSF